MVESEFYSRVRQEAAPRLLRVQIRRGGGWKKRMAEGSMREWDGRNRGRTGRKRKERDIVIEGAIIGLARNLALGKFPGISQESTRMTPDKTLSNSGGGA